MFYFINPDKMVFFMQTAEPACSLHYCSSWGYSYFENSTQFALQDSHHLPPFTHFSFVYRKAQVMETLLIRTLATPSGQ